MATTVQVSKESRDRLRALGRPGSTLEDTLIEAMDALERDQFWAAAEAAASRRRSLSRTEIAAIEAAEAETQRWLDAL